MVNIVLVKTNYKSDIALACFHQFMTHYSKSVNVLTALFPMFIQKMFEEVILVDLSVDWYW